MAHLALKFPKSGDKVHNLRLKKFNRGIINTKFDADFLSGEQAAKNFHNKSCKLKKLINSHNLYIYI